MKKFAGDIIILHMCTENHNHMMHGSWDTEWDGQHFLSFWAIFLPFYHQPTPHSPSPNHPENQNFEKECKKCLEILSLYRYRCTINVDHLIYGSWNIRCNRQKCLSFWATFGPFSHLTSQKIKILKLKKTPGDIIILQICTINHNLLMYGSWDMERDEQNFLSFWTIFCPFTPLWTQKIKILKKWKKYLKILSFYKHKWQSYDAWFLRYGVQRTEIFVILDCFCPFTP